MQKPNTAPLLAVLTAFSLALLAFWSVASEVSEGDFDAFDRALMLALRVPGDLSDPIGPGWVEVAMRDLTALGGFVVLTLLTAAVVVHLLLRRHASTAVFVIFAVGGGQVLSHLAKYAFDRPRPDLVSHAVEVSSSSFPSGHSMMAAVTYLTLAAMLSRIEPSFRLRVFYLIVAVVLAGLVGVSRVYLGVHWPSDVLAGWAAGGAWAFLCYLIARLLARRGQIERGQDRAG